MPSYRHELKARQLITEEIARHLDVPHEDIHSLAMLLEIRENANRDIVKMKRDVAAVALKQNA